MMRAARGILSGALGLCLFAAPHDAHADETKDCATAYEQTQRLQQKSEMISALDAADRCARPTCPALLKDECTRWVSEIKPKLPGLVVRVRGADGCARTEANVDVGGGSRKDPDSNTILLDPGIHDIIVTDPASGASKKQTINFAPGERRDIDIDFAAPGAVCGSNAPAKKSAFAIPKVTMVLGAIGGGLLLIGGGLGLIGAIKIGDLDDCKPNCSQDQIDGVRPFFIAGDVFAAFGLLALGAGVVTLVSADAPATPKATTSPSRIVVGPTGVFGTF